MSRLRPAVVIGPSAVTMSLALTLEGPSSVRTLLVVWFLVVCPGLALVGPIGLRDPWLTIALATSLSLALDVLVAGALSYSGHWSPTTAMMILLLISLGGAVWHDTRARRAELAGGGA